MTAYEIAATFGGRRRRCAAHALRDSAGAQRNSPQQITIDRCERLLYSDNGDIDISTTDQASLQFDDASDRSPGGRDRVSIAVG